MSETLTRSIEDYLKAIFELTGNGEAASTTTLAARLGVAPASITSMVQKLSTVKPALVSYRKYQGVSLTVAGRRAALDVIRRHRLLEAWLVQNLGYSWDMVHNEADMLEHVISQDFEKRIAAVLGQPERDPHGETIPDADLVMPLDKSFPLASLKPGQKATVRRVHSQEPAFLKHLTELGLTPGAHLKALSVSHFDQVMHLHIQGRKEESVLGPAITNGVFVEIS